MARLGGAAGEGDDGALSRRGFLQRAGVFGAALATVDLAALLDAQGLLEEARAQSSDLTRDTFNGLAASSCRATTRTPSRRARAAPGPGAIAAGAVAR